ncbi:MAG: universal stress protein [Anaerolineae bacterium]|nr:MAG: universal stress protein [Anaerolineae bacterium]
MYRKILVPLDGSAFAEQALPHVHNLLAHRTDPVQVHLLLVMPLVQNYSVSMANLYPFFPRPIRRQPCADIERVERDLRTYLAQTAEQVTAGGDHNLRAAPRQPSRGDSGMCRRSRR